jgi:hypothetical protein
MLALLAFVVPAAATADKPDKYQTPFSDLDIPAGVVCSFETLWHTDPNKGFEIDRFNKNGSFAWAWGGGNNVAQITNASNPEKSVSINTTGPGKITINDDGSLTIDGSGHWLVADGPGDSPPSSLLFYSGHIVLHRGLDGSLSVVSYVGAPAQDICALLA